MTTDFRRFFRRSSIAGAAAALAVAMAAPAGAAPGENFPEQPGTNLAQGCLSLLTNPDRALNFLTGEQHMSDKSAAILIAQYIDACSDVIP